MSLQPFQIINSTSQQILLPILNPVQSSIVTNVQSPSFTQNQKLDINQLAEKYSQYESKNNMQETLKYEKYQVTNDFEDFLDLFSQNISKKLENQNSNSKYTLSYTPQKKVKQKKNIDELANDYSKSLVLSNLNKNYENSEQSFSLSLSKPIHASLILINSPSVNLYNPSQILKSYIQYFFGSIRNFQRLMIESQSGVLVTSKKNANNPFSLFTSNTKKLIVTNETILTIENITNLIPIDVLIKNVTKSYETYTTVSSTYSSTYSPRVRPSPTFTPNPTNKPHLQIYNGYFNKPTQSQLPQYSPSFSPYPSITPSPSATSKPQSSQSYKPLIITYGGYWNQKPTDYSGFFGINQKNQNLLLTNTSNTENLSIPPIGAAAQFIENGVDALGSGIQSASNALVVYSNQAGIPDNYTFYGIPLLFISILLLSAFFKMYKSINFQFNSGDNIVFICHSKGISKAKINPLWKFKNLKESIFIWNDKNGIQINLNIKVKSKKVNEKQYIADFFKTQVIRGNNKITNKKFIVFTIEKNELVYFHLENYVSLK